MSRKYTGKKQRKMQQPKQGSENLGYQYREVFPAGSRQYFLEYENLAQPEQYVMSQNFTTYSTGEMPIPTPMSLRRA